MSNCISLCCTGSFSTLLLPDDNVQGLMLHDHGLDVLSAPHALQCAQYRGHLSGQKHRLTGQHCDTFQTSILAFLVALPCTETSTEAHLLGNHILWKALFGDDP